MLIAERTSDGQNSSIFTNELNQDQRGWVLDSINSTAPRLEDEQRHIYMREVIQIIPSLKDLKDYQIAKKLAEVALKVIPDINTSQTRSFDLAWANEQPSTEQRAEIYDFLALVGQKLSPDKLDDRIQQLIDDARWTDDPFGKNYAGIFSGLRDWVMDDRGMERKFDLMQQPKLAEYKISDEVITPITSEIELRGRLAQLPVEYMPNTTRLPRGKQSAEMVQLVEVVGGSDIKDWTVSASEGRGLSKIYELTTDLQKGYASVAGKNEPIKVVEIDGKYFVETDGRHRTAALKALGVSEAPMLVTHIKK